MELKNCIISESEKDKVLKLVKLVKPTTVRRMPAVVATQQTSLLVTPAVIATKLPALLATQPVLSVRMSPKLD